MFKWVAVAALVLAEVFLGTACRAAPMPQPTPAPQQVSQQEVPRSEFLRIDNIQQLPGHNMKVIKAKDIQEKNRTVYTLVFWDGASIAVVKD